MANSAFRARTGPQGTSGYSGLSGYSGISGYSGYSGISGYSGTSGVSVNKNFIINGDMKIAQRGTSFVSPSTTNYTLDRWMVWFSSDAIQTISQDTDVPATDVYKYSLKWDITTADDTIGAGQYAVISHRIEGYNFTPLVGKTATLSFWVKSPKTGTHCIAFKNSGADRAYVSEYTVNSANTWEEKSVTVTFDYSGGTWDYTTGIGLNICFALACGADFQTSASSWQTGNYLGTSNQVNCLDNTSNNFYLTGVQLEIGSSSTEFEYRTVQQELILCQRYYERIGSVQYSPYCHSYLAASSVGAAHNIYYKVRKRATPTVDVIGTWTVSNCGQPDAYYPNQDLCCIIAVSTGAGMVTFYPADETCYVDISSEL